jgi:hypothetical protein
MKPVKRTRWSGTRRTRAWHARPAVEEQTIGGCPRIPGGLAPASVLCVAVVLVTSALHAAIVDRIAVTAGAQVITDSEIDRRIRLTAFESGAKPSFDPAVRKAAADKLIDEKLIEREMYVGHYPGLSEERRKSLLADFAKAGFKSDDAAMEKALAAYRLTRGDLEDDLARQADLLTFLSFRFRPSVQVTDQEIREYFQKNILPKLQNNARGHEDTAAIDDYRAQIETQLTNQRADAEMEAWLKDQRKRTRILYLEKELAP